MIEDFLARSGIERCTDFRDTAEAVAKVGFKMFLNISPNVTNWTSDFKEFSLIIEDNPLTEFVELPEEALKGGLWHSNIYCGVLRGALEMVSACIITVHSTINFMGTLGPNASGSAVSQ